MDVDMIGRTARDLRALCEQSGWDADTSAYPAWMRSRPSKGQCAVTAAVVQDVLGGEVMRAVVDRDSHYWNVVTTDDGQRVELDLTRDQFPVWMPTEVSLSTRERIMGAEATVARYELLRSRLVTVTSERDLIGAALRAAAGQG